MEDELDKSRQPCPRLRDFSRSWSSSLLTICPGLNLSDSTALHEGTISRYRELCRKLPSIKKRNMDKIRNMNWADIEDEDETDFVGLKEENPEHSTQEFEDQAEYVYADPHKPTSELRAQKGNWGDDIEAQYEYGEKYIG